MGSQITFQLDHQEFDRALKELVAFNRRELPLILNKVAADVAYNAAGFTPKTTKGAIKRDLGKKVSSESGSTRLVYKIINASQRRYGAKGLAGERMSAAVTGLIDRRVQSIAFLRSGFAKAIQDLGRKYRGRASFKPEPKRSKGIKANYRNLEANIFYFIPTKQERKGRRQIVDIVANALQNAVSYKTTDMLAYVERKLKEGAQRFNR